MPPDLEIHLVVDNYSPHKSAAVQWWLKPRAHRPFPFPFTPTSSSWLNSECRPMPCTPPTTDHFFLPTHLQRVRQCQSDPWHKGDDEKAD